MKSAKSLSEAVQVVEDDIKALVAKAMGVKIAEIDAGKPLFDCGGKSFFCYAFLLLEIVTLPVLNFYRYRVLVDSFQAVEIRNRALKITQEYAQRDLGPQDLECHAAG